SLCKPRGGRSRVALVPESPRPWFEYKLTGAERSSSIDVVAVFDVVLPALDALADSAKKLATRLEEHILAPPESPFPLTNTEARTLLQAIEVREPPVIGHVVQLEDRLRRHLAALPTDEDLGIEPAP